MAWYLSYDQYLKSPLFRAVRDIEMRESGGICRKCGSIATEVHHRSVSGKESAYPPWGCWEVPGNIEAICHECHCREHGKQD